jgi:phage shock protein PspC (stress-responsive transcriptional regulator)
MKSTIKVSISGIAFNLDNDAYGCLRNYLDHLENIFSGKESGREIIEDIEVRIAELLSARIQSPAQIITLATVKEVIDTVGSVDDIAGDEESTADAASKQFKAPETERKRLFRDIDHRVIGGVCSGLGNYFGIDRVFIRLAFAVAFGCFLLQDYTFLHSFFNTIASVSVFLYIVLWIVTPAARTMNEKMRMRKEPLLPALPALPALDDGITKAAHEGDFGRVLGKIITITFRIIAGFVLAIIAFVALSLLVALPIGLFTGNTVLGELGSLDIAEALRTYTIVPLWVVVTLLTLLVCLPLVGLIYFLAKVLFKFKTKIRMGLILSVVWLVSFFSLAGLGIYLASGDFDFSLFLEDNAPRVSETRTVIPFHSLNVSGNFEVIAVPSDSNYMLIKAAENILPNIRVETNDGNMKIFMTKMRGRWRSKSHISFYYSDWESLKQLRLSGAVRFACPDTLKAETFSAKLSGASILDIVVNNEYSDLEISGATKVDVAGQAKVFTAEASGASKITADIITEKTKVDLSGAGNLILSGAASRADFQASGASRINASGFVADSVKVRLSGSSKLGVHANQYLNIHASGVSHIEYSGTPVTDISTSGAAKVIGIRNCDKRTVASANP